MHQADYLIIGGGAVGMAFADTIIAETDAHVTIVDRHGNMAAVTQTLLSIFGSRVVSPSTGLLLNNGILWFDPEPGKPNSLGPGKRCLANYCPVVGEAADGRRWVQCAQQGKGQPAAERMAACLRQPQRNAARLRVERGNIGARFAQRQRAGLVEQGDIAFGEALQRAAVLHQQAAPQQCARGDHLRGGHGEAHGAGTGDDQHRNRDGERLVHACACDHPSHERQRCEAMDHRRIKAAGAVGDADIGAARLPGLVHQPGDFGNRGIIGHAGQRHADRRRQVDRAGMDDAPRPDRFRRAFSGEHGVVDRAAAIDHFAIGGERLSGGDKKMTQVGWAADGFPVYAIYAFAKSEDPKSELKKMKSSYRLKTDDRGGDGKTTPTGKPDGSFGLDFEYVAGHGDLDEFGGRSGVTPEFPKGTYYYVMTEEYPFIPRKHRGTPDPSFSKQKMDPHANLGGQGGPGAKGGTKGKKGPPPEGAPK